MSGGKVVGRTKLAVGGLAVLGLAALINGLINGFGTGEGIGDGTSNNFSQNQPANEDETTSETTEEETTETPSGPLRVVVEPDGYSIVSVKDGERTYAKAELADIVKRAPSAEVLDGYRVYVTVRRGVSIDAHNKLVKGLEEAGLEADEILGYDNKDAEVESRGGAS